MLKLKASSGMQRQTFLSCSPTYFRVSCFDFNELVVFYCKHTILSIQSNHSFPLSLPFLPLSRCAWLALNMTWRTLLPSRQARTRCAVSAWKWFMTSHPHPKEDLASFQTAITPTACPVSVSGGGSSSLRIPSSSKFPQPALPKLCYVSFQTVQSLQLK